MRAVTGAAAMVGVVMTAALGAVLATQTPVAAQVDATPDPNCGAGAPSWRECDLPPSGGSGQGGGGGGRTCSWLGVRLPSCWNQDFGQWLGAVDWTLVFYPRGHVGLTGCYGRAAGQMSPWGGPLPPPPAELATSAQGGWWTISCFGPTEVVWPPPYVALVWLEGGAGPDPEELARRALAAITMRVPELELAPPSSGSVPLGMPVWVAVAQTVEVWGPASSGQVCDGGLCVEVVAAVTRVDWEMGDGATVSCDRGQNIAWRPGLDFLNPGSACHHWYERPSRGESGGVFEVAATTTWRAEWSGGGQSGVFEAVSDVCGPGSDETCRSVAAMRVEELQVLVTRGR